MSHTITRADDDALLRHSSLDEWAVPRTKSAAEIERELRAAESWPERQPLPDARLDTPALPSGLLPDALRSWLEDAAERLQVPTEMLAAPALVAAASLIGRSIGILPKRRDDWLVIPNLWGMVVGRPGVMKSPAMREATRPLELLAAEAHEKHTGAAAAALVEAEAIEVEIAKLKTQARKDDHDAERFKRELTRLLDAKARLSVAERRYLTQDPTIEKLGELLNHNPRGLLLLRDELSGWIHTLSRAGREGERQFYLEAWNGLGSYTVDRIGRGTLHVPALTLAVFGTIQPAKLSACLATGDDGGDGLLQRFSLTVWPEASGEWRNVDRCPDTGARQRAFDLFRRLDALTPADTGATTEHSEVPALRFAADAQELFDAWRAEVERRLRSDDLRAEPAFEGHVAKYRKAMPALALTTHLLDVHSGSSAPGPVTLAATRRAAAWCEFLEAHARKVYAIEDPIARATRALAARLEAGEVADGATVRELYRRHWSGLTTPSLVDAAVARLDELRWLRLEDRDTRGRPSPEVCLHPDLRRAGGEP